MQPPYKIMFLFGTRAEVLKLAPIIRLIHQNPATWQPVLVATGNSQLLNDTLAYLNFQIDFSVDLSNATSTNEVELLSQLLHNLNNVINAGQPDMILVAGDATTTLAASLISFIIIFHLAMSKLVCVLMNGIHHSLMKCIGALQII